MNVEQPYDAWVTSRSEEEQAALRAGTLSWPNRKMQRWGHLDNWREAGPFDWTGCEEVEVIPGKLSGVPVLVGTRMSADNVLQHFEWGESPEEIAAMFFLSYSQILSVLRFAGAPVSGAVPA